MPALLRGAAVSCWWWLLVKYFKQTSGMTSFVMVRPFSVDCVFLGYLLLYLSSLEGRYWVWLTCVGLAWPFTGLWRSSVPATPSVTPRETNNHPYLLGRGSGFSLQALRQAGGRNFETGSYWGPSTHPKRLCSSEVKSQSSDVKWPRFKYRPHHFLTGPYSYSSVLHRLLNC